MQSWSLEGAAAVWSGRIKIMHLYIHVPFCVKKCNYCAFHSVECPVPDWDAYTAGILRQLDCFKASDFEIDTVFFGGGTPSLLPPAQAGKIIGKLHLARNAEFTLEANPKTLGSLELKDWKDFGINRLSIGMQSFDDDELRFLGRIHTVADSLALLDAARGLNLRTSMDFIYGLPGQTAADAEKMCEKINALGLPHASLYELSIEPGTKFANLIPPDDQNGAEMYDAIGRTLELPRYEVSNYGDPCLHNAAVWRGEEYIGVGESASGRIMRSGSWLETKITNGRVEAGPLSARDRAREIAMTGLRTARGVPACAAGINWPFAAANPQWFEWDGGSLRMTDSGLLLLDFLLKDIVL
ncbi:MAG: coproporphyrinogen III oxidase family protein [Rickettsiales bacterium]|nr:coproporphyrinogen III oxidase family protein [Rickettsiales bacterium]